MGETKNEKNQFLLENTFLTQKAVVLILDPAYFLITFNYIQEIKKEYYFEAR